MAFKVPRFLLNMKRNELKGTREGLFVEGFNLHLQENSNYIDNRLSRFYDIFYERMQSKGIEVLLIPGLSHPPVKHFQSVNSNIQAFYCFLCNAFNMPSGVIPVTHVMENEQVFEDEYKDKYT